MAKVAPTPTPVRCAIYTRKSTEEGLNQEFNSLDAQREAAEAAGSLSGRRPLSLATLRLMRNDICVKEISQARARQCDLLVRSFPRVGSIVGSPLHEDRVRGLDAGADDYLVKPFAFPELLARTRVLPRRGKPDASQRLRLADLEMDVAQRSVARGGQPIELTAREFELLEYLFASQGRVVSREMLARDIWKETALQTPLDNVIDAQIVRLRRKLDGQFERKLLHTVRGVGFVLREEDGS